MYTRPEGETTQWEDLQRKFGNLPEKDAVWKPAAFSPRSVEKLQYERLDHAKDPESLEDMQDEFEEDSFLETYRQIRLAQLKEAAKKQRYGTVSSIQRADFLREVTESSRDSWVVVLLNQEKILGCQVLLHCLRQLAEQYQHIKFISMLSTDCIPDYPNENLPTLLVYKDGQCKRTIVGLRTLGVDRISPESVAAGLNDVGPICTEADMAA